MCELQPITDATTQKHTPALRQQPDTSRYCVAYNVLNVSLPSVA